MFKFALVGCGYWGPNLLRNLHALSNCCVGVVCDTNPERLKLIQSNFSSIQTTMKFDDVIDNDSIGAVAIATPVFSHFELGRKCLSAGKHVFIESPMAATTDQCKELVEMAEEKSLTLMVGHTFIYNRAVSKIKEIIDQNELGEIKYISSRRLNLGIFQKDINVVWDLAPNDISIINYLLNNTPSSVQCSGKAHINPGIEDVTNMTLEYPNDCFVSVHNSWLDPNKVREMIIVGSKKMLVYNDMEPVEKIKIYDKRVECPPHYETFGEFHYGYYYGDTHILHVKPVEPLRIECQHFYDCIQTGTIPRTSGWEGMAVVQILEAASKSLQNHGEYSGRVCQDTKSG